MLALVALLGPLIFWSCNAITSSKSNDTVAPLISYRHLTLNAIKGDSIVPDTVISTGGTVTAYSANPLLPTGLSLNSASGLISGAAFFAPDSLQDTITATGPAGIGKTVLTITVTDTSAVSVSPERRVFVNDAAANDSLVPALGRSSADSGGLVFVLQPGQSYHLRLATPSAGDQLALYGYPNNVGVSMGNLTPSISSNNDTELFTLKSTQSQASWFAVVLKGFNGNANAVQRISHVSLVSLDTAQSSSLNVNLIMVGDLTAAGLPDSAHKATFANSFLTELGTIYQGANNSGFSPAITFTGTYSIASATSPAEVVNFGPTFVPLPGTRIANAVNLYLVDSISFSGNGAGEEVLGFSPREVVDMSTDEDSRVILSARAAASTGGTITGCIPSLATTAAHEMGHFFGLRHPTATTVDLENDDDYSNQDDGFASTPFCAVLTKSGEHIVTAAYNKRAYCLYTAVAGCPSSCDITNLMFAYSCGNTPQAQRMLTSEQQVFFRRNLALLQGLGK